MRLIVYSGKYSEVTVEETVFTRHVPLAVDNRFAARLLGEDGAIPVADFSEHKPATTVKASKTKRTEDAE